MESTRGGRRRTGGSTWHAPRRVLEQSAVPGWPLFRRLTPPGQARCKARGPRRPETDPTPRPPPLTLLLDLQTPPHEPDLLVVVGVVLLGFAFQLRLLLVVLNHGQRPADVHDQHQRGREGGAQQEEGFKGGLCVSGLLVGKHENAEEGAQGRPDAAEARAVEAKVLEGQAARQRDVDDFDGGQIVEHHVLERGTVPQLDVERIALFVVLLLTVIFLVVLRHHAVLALASRLLGGRGNHEHLPTELEVATLDLVHIRVVGVERHVLGILETERVVTIGEAERLAQVRVPIVGVPHLIPMIHRRARRRGAIPTESPLTERDASDLHGILLLLVIATKADHGEPARRDAANGLDHAFLDVGLADKRHVEWPRRGGNDLLSEIPVGFGPELFESVAVEGVDLVVLGQILLERLVRDDAHTQLMLGLFAVQHTKAKALLGELHRVHTRHGLGLLDGPLHCAGAAGRSGSLGLE
mmetsp:Transcript_10574/g.28097  ORF Transcript_10574/g.28097 Transcript_10574/m.28097 type:complete len:469 (+) Transcript_10574:332-1738(+)